MMWNQFEVITRENEFLLQRKEIIILEISSKVQINFNIGRESSLKLENKIMKHDLVGFCMKKNRKEVLFVHYKYL